VLFKSRRRSGLARARAARAGSRGGVRSGVRWALLATLVGSVVAAVALTVVLLFSSASVPGMGPVEEPGSTDGWLARAERLAGGSAELAELVLGGELAKLTGAALEGLRPRHAEVPLRAVTVGLVVGGCWLALRYRRSGGGAGVVRVTAAVGVVGGLLAWPREVLRLTGLPTELLTRVVDGQALVADYWAAVATPAAHLEGTWAPLRPLVGIMTLAYLLPFAVGVLAAVALAVGAQVVLALNAAALAVELPGMLFGDRSRSLGHRVGLLLVGTGLLAGALGGLLGLLWAAAKLRTWLPLPTELDLLELLAGAGMAWLGLFLVVVVVVAWRKRRR
jgi:hypothetical protein